MKLTPREKSIVPHLVKGQSRKEIAGALKISCHTLDVYLVRLRAKTQTFTMRETALWFARNR